MNSTEMVQRGFEPVVAETMRRNGDFQHVCLASIAISLKRLADTAETAVLADVSMRGGR